MINLDFKDAYSYSICNGELSIKTSTAANAISNKIKRSSVPYIHFNDSNIAYNLNHRQFVNSKTLSVLDNQLLVIEEYFPHLTKNESGIAYNNYGRHCLNYIRSCNRINKIKPANYVSEIKDFVSALESKYPNTYGFSGSVIQIKEDNGEKKIISFNFYNDLLFEWNYDNEDASHYKGKLIEHFNNEIEDVSYKVIKKASGSAKMYGVCSEITMLQHSLLHWDEQEIFKIVKKYKELQNNPYVDLILSNVLKDVKNG